MSFPLSYCPHGSEVLKRLQRLYTDREPGIILASMDIPSPALDQFGITHPAGPCEYPDPRERAQFWDEHLRGRAMVLDDSIPCAYLSEMDQGLIAGLLGGKTCFLSDPGWGWISSMAEPLLKDWSDFDRMSFDPEHPWFRRYVNQTEIFIRAAAGKFGVSHFTLVDSLNFVFELFGATRTYENLIERPEMVKKAVDFAYALNLKIQMAFFDKVPHVEGGTCSNMAQWLPGRIISESVDPFHMTSVAYFEEWGREPVERMFRQFDGGVLHIHGNGRHLLEAVSTLKGLKLVWLGDDRGFPFAFDVLGEIRNRVGNLPLAAGVPYDKFMTALRQHRLTGGVFYRVSGVPDADAANRCMDHVRAYRA